MAFAVAFTAAFAAGLGLTEGLMLEPEATTASHSAAGRCCLWATVFAEAHAELLATTERLEDPLEGRHSGATLWRWLTLALADRAVGPVQLTLEMCTCRSDMLVRSKTTSAFEQ